VPQRRPRTAEDVAAQKGLGFAIRRLRRDKGWSQVALGIHSELSEWAIGNLERGEQEPTWGNLRRLAEGLAIPLGDLNRLAIDLAPGSTGDRLREGEREAVPVDVEAVFRRATEEDQGQQA